MDAQFPRISPLVEPEQFTDTPVLMIHPGDDPRTPLKISQPFFRRIAAEKAACHLRRLRPLPYRGAWIHPDA